MWVLGWDGCVQSALHFDQGRFSMDARAGQGKGVHGVQGWNHSGYRSRKNLQTKDKGLEVTENETRN